MDREKNRRIRFSNNLSKEDRTSAYSVKKAGKKGRGRWGNRSEAEWRGFRVWRGERWKETNGRGSCVRDEARGAQRSHGCCRCKSLAHASLSRVLRVDFQCGDAAAEKSEIYLLQMFQGAFLVHVCGSVRVLFSCYISRFRFHSIQLVTLPLNTVMESGMPNCHETCVSLSATPTV